MNKEFKVYKCKKCGAQVINFDDVTPDNKISCCKGTMTQLIPNIIDASYEKHVPTYEMDEQEITVKVNHVMDEEHYIEWIAYVADDNYEIIYLEPYMEASAKFNYVPNAKLYAFCNKHGLWESGVN